MATAETLNDLAGYAREGSFAGARTARIERLQAPGRAELGAAFVVRWRTDGAEQVRMRLRGALQGERELPAEGTLTLRAAEAGTVAIDLICTSSPAEPGAREVVATVMVNVKAPAAELVLSATRLAGPPGRAVRLMWSSSHASRVWLHRPAHGVEMELPPRGAADLCITPIADEVVLGTLGLDGSPGPARTCRLIPHRPAAAARADGASTWFSKPLEELSSWI